MSDTLAVRCDDCGNDARSELYWHEQDGAWVCEEVPDCRERQFDQMSEHLRVATEALEEIVDDLSVPSHPAPWATHALQVATMALEALPSND